MVAIGKEMACPTLGYEVFAGMYQMAYKNLKNSDQADLKNENLELLRSFLAVCDDIGWGNYHNTVDDIKESIQKTPEVFKGLTVKPFNRTLTYGDIMCNEQK